MKLRGKVSWFGGPEDTGVSPDEGLAFVYEISDAPHLFLPKQPSGTTGLARRLDPEVFYLACRWDYDVYPKPSLLQHTALVRSPKPGRVFEAYPADWGPHKDTGRIADISSGLMSALGIQTDDEVEVIYPAEEITMPKAQVIDISHHNTIPQSLDDAAASGILGVIHKLTEGTSYVDDKVQARRHLTLDAGMLWGVYHFIRPGNIAKQADFFLTKGEQLGVADEATLWVLDWEDTGVSLDDALEFLAAIEEEISPRLPVVYSGHVLKEALGGRPDARINRYPLWLAQYASDYELPPGWEHYFLWQYTDQGHCPGINPPVDLNAYEGTAEELEHDWTGGVEPIPRPAPTPPDARRARRARLAERARPEPDRVEVEITIAVRGVDPDDVRVNVVEAD
jgi:GH25 family lysozyme M1 (1,4-beta-N-acetylmuramidase)